MFPKTTLVEDVSEVKGRYLWQKENELYGVGLCSRREDSLTARLSPWRGEP
jgi:hypothetical protein